MTTLEGITVVVVTERAAPEVHVRALEGAGATVTVLSPTRNLWSGASEETIHLFVVVSGEGELAPSSVVDLLKSEPRAVHIPVLVLLAPRTSLESLRFAIGVSVLGNEAPEAEFLRAVSLLTEPFRRLDDASERMRALETELRTQVSRVSEAKKELHAFAHDLRVLLGLVVGFGANLRDKILGPLTEAQEEHVRRILEAAADANTLVGEHAAFKVQTPSLPPDAASRPRTIHRTPHDVSALVVGIAELFREKANEKKLRMTVLPTASPARMWGDAMQLKQVVTNLMVNAIKYTPEGGSIEVSVSVGISSRSEGIGQRRRVEVRIEDSGPGVGEADRETVFRRGVRLERDKDIPGTGIGLSVVRDIVSAHGGTVWVENSKLGGAAFVVDLPIDLRTRERAMLMVREHEGVERLVRLLCSADPGQLRLLSGTPEALIPALSACRAMVVLPTDSALAKRLDEALEEVAIPASLRLQTPDGGSA